MDDGFVHVHAAVAAFLVVAEGVVAEIEEAPGRGWSGRGALSRVQGPAECHEGLEGRARGRPVEARLTMGLLGWSLSSFQLSGVMPSTNRLGS